MEEKTCDNCVWKENECFGEDVCEQYLEANDEKDRRDVDAYTSVLS